MNTKPNYDPLLQLVFDIHDSIFQHLTKKDVKTCSEVSKLWNETISSSRVCVSKLRIRLDQVNSQNFNVDRISRRYTSLLWDTRDNSKNAEFQLEILKRLQRKLRAIEIVNIHRSFQLEDLHFPHLRKLKVNWCATVETFENIVRGFSRYQLETLEINIAKNESIVEFVSCQRQLKRLKLSGGSQNIFCYEESRMLQRLRLKSLHIGTFAARTEDPAKKQNFLSFLESQSATLTHLTIATGDNEVLNKVYSMPNIKILKIAYQNSSDIRDLPINKSVECALITSSLHYTDLVRNLPNLKQIFVDMFSCDKINMIVRHVPKIKKIFFVDLSNSPVEWKNFQLMQVQPRFKFRV